MTEPSLERFIVAEISKNWPADGPMPSTLLSHDFEKVIAINLARGYALHSFQMHRLMVGSGRVKGQELNETIIAVFEKRTFP